MEEDDVEYATQQDYTYVTANLNFDGSSEFCEFDELCNETKKELAEYAQIYYDALSAVIKEKCGRSTLMNEE